MCAKASKQLSPTHIDERYAAIYAVVQRIPRGKVSSYGVIASLAGLPRRARLAGKALKLTPTKLRIPWHRVTTSNGRLAFTAGSAAYREQCRLLAREGIVVVKQRVDMLKHAWPPRTINLDELLWRD